MLFMFRNFSGKSVPLLLPSFQPLPFHSLFAIFIHSVFEVVQVGQVVQPRQPWLCAVPPEKCQSEKWDRFSNGCPTLYHFFLIKFSKVGRCNPRQLCVYHLSHPVPPFLRHVRLHSDTEDAGGKPVNPGFADLRQANLRLVFPVAAGLQAFCFLA